jgi:hypothetical protein
MGASSFESSGKGKSAKEVFDRLVSQSQYESGHSYSGEIGMKRDFQMCTLPQGMSVRDFINKCFDDESHFCQDKWGPAACVKVGEDTYVFFGYASS